MRFEEGLKKCTRIPIFVIFPANFFSAFNVLYRREVKVEQVILQEGVSPKKPRFENSVCLFAFYVRVKEISRGNTVA